MVILSSFNRGMKAMGERGSGERGEYYFSSFLLSRRPSKIFKKFIRNFVA